DYEPMVVPTYYRTAEEFTAPLRDGGECKTAFDIESCQETALDDPLWSEFQRTGDVRDYATKAADFFRAFSEPSLFGRLAAATSADHASTIADSFYGRVRDAIELRPADAECNWRLLLLSLARK